MILFDVFFISHGEANADENWENLRRLCPRAQRLDGIDGLYQVHRACAVASTTENFFVVDADAWVFDDFGFDLESTPDPSAVTIWHARNPVNGLEYGYGGIKLFPRQPFLEDRAWDTDLSTTIGSAVIVNETVACETRFNATPESAWIGAFRECAKLSSLRSVTGKVKRRAVARQQALDSCVLDTARRDWTDEQKWNHLRSQTAQYDEKVGTKTIYDHWAEIEQASYRSSVWTRFGWFKPNGEHVLLGARSGFKYGLYNADDDAAMSRINDWTWLRERFQEYSHG